MGLAASQARLLTITARLADNELRSQTINNAKMRLATQSAQASNDYVNALNNAQLVFTNTDINGLTQTQPLTFKSLTQYSQYNTQYGLVNSSGQMLVSEEDAKIFEANKNSLEGFLKAHGLEWETTFFDNNGDDYNKETGKGGLQEKLTSFYSSDYSYIGDFFKGMTNDDLKNLYLDSISEEASIEALAYKNVCQAYAADIKNGRTVLYPKFVEGAKGGKSEDEIINEIKGLGSAENVISALLENSAYSLANIKQYMNDPTQIETLVKKLADTHESSGISLLKEASVADEVTDITPENVISITIDGNNLYNATVYNFGGTEIDANHATDESGHKYTPKFSIINANGKTYIKCNQDGYQYKNEYGSYTTLNAEQYTEIKSSATNMDKESEVQDILKNITNSVGSVRIEYNCISTSDGELKAIRVPFDGTTNTVVYEAMAREYLSYIFHNPSNFNAMAYAQKNGQYYNKIAEEFESYGLSVELPEEMDCVLDFDTLLKTKNYDSDSGNDININTANSKLKSVLKTYMTEKMVDVLGEPKYAWIDKSLNPTDNPDSKAQWLSNLFNRMQKGYKVLENGLANSTEWIEYAFESGLVTMEQVDLSQNWISMDYKTCASINENTDNSAMVAIAEAKYNRAMNDIKQKDSMYDLQLKNIDTEHSALQTEYDVIKDVIKKNIERTMKFDQSA